MTTKISTKDISELRARTGAGIGDCKAALEEAQGELDRAAELLRSKGITRAEKRAGRSASQGLVVIAADPSGASAAMIDLNCETDFVARTDDFRSLARDLADHALRHAPLGVNAGSVLDQPFRGRTVGEIVKEVSGKTGEAMALARVARFTGADGVVGAYAHFNGQVGVLVEVQGPRQKGLAELAGELALHEASADPVAVSEADLPADLIARERRIAEEQVAAEGKPEAIRAKIVEGKVRKYVTEQTLLGQAFVKDEKKKVGDLVKDAAQQLGGEVRVVRFVRFKVGEA
jgi:elongation factor Ts